MDIEDLQSDYESMTVSIARWMQETLSHLGVPEQWVEYVKLIVLLAIVTITVYLLQLVVRKTFFFRIHHKQ